MDGLKNLHRYEDVMCFQSKVDRELAYKYDVIRRLMGKTRRQSLEDYFQHEIDLYNSIIGSAYERTIDFVNMHYSKSKKTGPFWTKVKEKHNPSAMQYYYEDLMKFPGGKMNPPSFFNYAPFKSESWMCVMSQMDFDKVPKQTNFHSPRNKNIHYYRLIEQEATGVDYPEFMKQIELTGNYFTEKGDIL